MKLKARDTIHISSVKAENIVEGEIFEVSDPVGNDLVKRGLAAKVGGAKAAAKPRNKAAAKPNNK
jgi:hypothetical protein